MRSQTRTGGRDFYTVTAGIFFITLLPILLTVCTGRTGDTGQSAPTAPDSEAAAEVVSARRRILYVDSYHAEYEASIMRQGAAREILEAADIEMRVVYLDAKRKRSDDDLKAAALRVKGIIDSWQPDLVIAAEDAASKYLVMPYFRNRDLPFIFPSQITSATEALKAEVQFNIFGRWT